MLFYEQTHNKITNIGIILIKTAVTTFSYLFYVGFPIYCFAYLVLVLGNKTLHPFYISARVSHTCLVTPDNSSTQTNTSLKGHVGTLIVSVRERYACTAAGCSEAGSRKKEEEVYEDEGEEVYEEEVYEEEVYEEGEVYEEVYEEEVYEEGEVEEEV